MKKRTIAYVRRVKAMKIMQNPLQADLNSFLSAAMELTKNRVVKRHIKDSLYSLSPKGYQLTA